MDKNKNRSDLLAAGRKKLQQFRQKKDGKGSKSSGKSGKPEQNVAAEAGDVTAKPAVVSVHVPDGEGSSVEDSYSVVNDAPAPCAGENFVSTSTNAAAIDQSLMPVLPKAGIVDVPLEESRPGEIVLNPSVGREQFVDSSDINEGQSTCIVDTEDSRAISLGTSETILSEVKSVYAGVPGPIDLSTPLDLVDDVNPVTVAVDFPRGEDQDADNLGSKQVDRSSGIELGVDERLSLSELGDNAETHPVKNSGETAMQEAPHEAESANELDVSASSGATNQLEGLGMDGHSVLSHHFPELDGSSTLNPVVTDQKIDDAVVASFNVEKSVAACKPGDYGSSDKEGVQVDMQDNTVDPEGVSITKVHGQDLPLGSKVVNLSFGANISSITLSQLVEVLRGLDENDFKFMLTSRESINNADLVDSGGSIVSEYDIYDVLERLKEQLYLTSFAKEVFYMQLSEQSKLKMELDFQNHQLVDEISIANVSLNEVKGRNTTLNQELAQSRSELQALACLRDQLQKQYHAAKVETEELSARAEELNIKLEKSQGDLLSLSEELSNCRSSLAASHVDIDNLRGSLTVLTEEKRKLEDEKVYFVLENGKLSTELADCRASLTSLQVQNVSLNENLALMTDERWKLEEEKEHIVLENQKLSTDLADCRTWMKALQVENANLTATLSEERKNLLEEKESFAYETKKLSTELMDCRGLLEAQQVEIANLNGSLALAAEERSKLGEERQNFLGGNDTELADCKGSVADPHVKESKAVDDLKDATLYLEQLAKENASLKSNLDVHEAKSVEFDNSSSKISSESQYKGDQVGNSGFTDRSKESAADYNAFHEIPEKWDSETSSSMFREPLPDGIVDSSDLENLKLDAYDDSFGFVVLKGRMKEMEKVLQKLENAIEGLHFHLITLSRSNDEVAVPAVSKLIQAFESKAYPDDPEAGEAKGVEEVPLPENQSFADPFLLTKEEIQNLKVMLKELVFDADNASKLFKRERDAGILVNVALKERSVANEALKEHINILEASNIELVVLDEIMKNYVYNNEAKKGEFLVFFDALRRQEIILEAHNKKLAKLNDYQLKISDLHSVVNEMHLSSDEMASSICNQVENLYRDVDERGAIFEQEWNSTVSEIIQTIGKLDASVGCSFLSTVSSNTYYGLDISSHVSASVDAATKVIEDLHEKLQAATTDYETMRISYETMTLKFNDLHGKNELAVSLLDKIYGNLQKLLSNSCGCVEQSEELLDLLCPAHYDAQIEKLGMFLYERLQLESENRKLNLELMDRAKDIEELNKRCCDLDAISKLVEDVEGVPELVETKIVPDKCASHLVPVISFLVRKYKEADDQLSSSREMFSLKETELVDLKGQADQLSFLIVQYENEMLILKESLSQALKDHATLHSELQEKLVELEQSEQRVSSLREKLGIAVSKGKGLVVQRDSLKQSLAEMSGELEKCLQELQLKDARLCEVETKLKTYSEAGERVEALESELSYIRNSATALRESFLLKDSVLQRIEEILEDLELPEHFHSRDIIEKVDWLARSVTGNSLPLTDWDQKSSMGGGSYSDTGFVVMDAWKEDLQLNSSSGDDLRKKYDELQSKFYGLAEQNEMLEQSLVERNNVVQRWEEILDRINMPSHLRSVEPVDRIELLVRALSEADHHCNSLQQKIDNFETMCGSLTADLEGSQRKSSNLEAALQAVMHEKEQLSESLERLTHDYGEVSKKSSQFKLDIVKLQDEVNALQERLVEKVGTEERIQHIEDEMRRLRKLVNDVLQDAGIKDDVSDDSNMEGLEQLLRKFMEKYKTFSLGNRVLNDAVDEHITDKADATLDAKGKLNSGDTMEDDMIVLKKELENVLADLTLVKEERDRYMERSQSLVHEVEALDIKRRELQELLNLEEQKSASVREKLNVAVRKGKSLVQQRDSLKQAVEETNTELERLRSDISSQENTLSQYKQKMRDLSTYQETVEALESESTFLRDRLAETEFSLQEKGHAMNVILNTLSNIDVGFEFNISDPVEKLKQIGRLCHDLHAAVASSEHDSSKSKRAAELLLAELNEVQERNDGLQEDLEKAMGGLSEAFRKRDSAEAAKYEAVSHLQKLSTELVALKSSVDQLRKDFYDVSNLLGDHLSQDLEYLHNLESSVNSFRKPNDVLNVVGVPLGGAYGNIMSSNSEKKENFLTTVDSLSESKMQLHFDDNILAETCSAVGHQLQDFVIEMGALKEKLYKHSILQQEEAKRLSEEVGIVHKEMKSQRQSFESMKEKLIRLEQIEKEKNTESEMLRRNISLLYEACTSSIMEIKNWKVQMVGNGLDAPDQGVNLELPAFFYGDDLFSGRTLLSSEECIQTMANRLLSAVKESVRIQTEIVEGGEKEMKTTISNLQKELQEKDIQKERICVELVSQIKEAEAAAKGYLLDLQSTKVQVSDLERKIEVMEEEHSMLQHRVKELQDGEVTLKDLQERVRSLTNVLTAKEQEIEALMQALDEEETQMEDLTNKIAELEKILQQKNLDMENLEASRGKAIKKLSITVSKFDELHGLSASLLSEVEKLQSQLHERDTEISFLRQEVTRCTNDALIASQLGTKRKSDEIHDLLTWLNTMISQVHNVQFDDKKISQVDEFKEILQKQIFSIISELEDLRVVAQNRDTLLQVERSRVEELVRKEELLENSLREKESQLSMLQGVGDSGQATNMTSEIVEVEEINKWAVPGTSIAPQVRSLRKVNNDQVAIAIDMDQGSGSRLEDEDDDKAHGFKSLTTSRVIPRFTRPVTDMIDGLWVSCDRALMRQPALRLGVIIYWAVLHALLATFVV